MSKSELNLRFSDGKEVKVGGFWARTLGVLTFGFGASEELEGAFTRGLDEIGKIVAERGVAPSQEYELTPEEVARVKRRLKARK